MSISRRLSELQQEIASTQGLIKSIKNKTPVLVIEGCGSCKTEFRSAKKGQR